MDAVSVLEEKAAYMRDLCIDKVFASLDEPSREKYLETCISLGQHIADDFTARYGVPSSSKRLCEIAEENGVTVKEIKDDGKLPFLSEYISSFGARIELFPKKIQQTEEYLRSVNPDFFSSVSMKGMCIAHELFHHIERGLLKGTGRIVSIPVKRLGIFPAVHYVSQASEAAAHTFVKHWLKLSFSPYLFREIIENMQKAHASERGNRQ